MSRQAIEGVRDLARHVNRSPSSISGWTKRPDWPFGPPPWPEAKLEKILAWAEKTLQRSDGNPELKAARVELLQEQLLLLNTTNGIAAGLHLDGDTVERLMVGAIRRFSHAMVCAGATIAARTVGADLQGATEAIREHLQWLVNDHEEEIRRIPKEAEADSEAIEASGGDSAELEDSDYPGEGSARAAAAEEARSKASGKGGHSGAHRVAHRNRSASGRADPAKAGPADRRKRTARR